MISIKNWTDDHSEKIIELLKSELNWDVAITKADPADSVAPEELKRHQIHKFDIFRSTELLVSFPSVPERVQLLEAMDCIVELHGKQWPELLLVAAVKRALRRKVKTLDINQAAYVVGEGSDIRPLVMAATELGFGRICIVSADTEWLENEKKFLERRLVGIKFETVLTGDLTLQPQDTNLLLNSFNLHKHKEYLQDLAYFNFMVSGGVVVDLNAEGPHQILQDEATKAQLTVIKPDEILLAWWLELALKLKPNFSFTKQNENNLFDKL